LRDFLTTTYVDSSLQDGRNGVQQTIADKEACGGKRSSLVELEEGPGVRLLENGPIEGALR